MSDTIDKAYFAGVVVKNGLAEEDSISKKLGKIGSVSGDDLSVAFDWDIDPRRDNFWWQYISRWCGGGNETHG